MKKTISLFLSLLLLLTLALPAVASADTEEPNGVPVIFIVGLNTDPLVDADTGETVWPVDSGVITDAVKRALTPDDVTKIISGDYQPLMKRIANEVENVAGKIMVDEDGNSIYNIVPSVVTDLTQDFTAYYDPVKGYNSDHAIVYHYDWRLSPIDLIGGLNDLVQAVKSSTGSDKVRLCGFSYGSCILSAYLEKYGVADVDAFSMLAGAYNGMDSVGALFKGQAALSFEAIANFMGGTMDSSLGSQIIISLIELLGQFGVDKALTPLAETLLDALGDDVFTMIRKLFFSWGSFWSFVPYEAYDDAKAHVLTFNQMSDSFLEKADHYHSKVQGTIVRRFRSYAAQGVRFGIIAEYGSAAIPVSKETDLMGDTNIETRRESLGAVCAKAGRTLGDGYVQEKDDGHSHISPDNMIDASGCTFPENTWFVKNAMHVAPRPVCELCDYVMGGETQRTVWDPAGVPQFTILTNGGIEPLTQENDKNLCPYENTDIFGKFKKVFEFFGLLFQWFKTLFK